MLDQWLLQDKDSKRGVTLLLDNDAVEGRMNYLQLLPDKPERTDSFTFSSQTRYLNFIYISS
jgi:hypothetical protein